jgi:hypothetical protein
MLSRGDSRCTERESDDGDQLQGGLMKISDMKTRFALGKGVIFVPVHVPR